MTKNRLKRHWNFFVSEGRLLVYQKNRPSDLDSSGCLTLIIPDNVDDFMYDDNYVVAHQNPVFIRADYYWEYGKGYDKDSIDQIKRLCKDIQDCYWIICKYDDSVLGPMSYDEYKEKCEILDVKIKLCSTHK